MKVTVRDILEAARKNGMKHVHGDWYQWDEEREEYTAGCIMGQAYKNLTGEADETGADEMAGALNQVSLDLNLLDRYGQPVGLGTYMIEQNDFKTKADNYRPYNKLVDIFENRAKEILDRVVEW